ncbi:MAG: hypothetical protein PHR36_04120 [Patescibacteria group bacterium]|nr:hypothetical protein [Patescibacteria group bacterium]
MVQATTLGRATFLRTFTDTGVNITVGKGEVLPIISWDRIMIQCLVQGQDGECPISVPRDAVRIEK